MKTQPLGNTGISVSPITIGAWQLGGPLFLTVSPTGIRIREKKMLSV